MNQGMNTKNWAVLLLTAGLFGSSFFFIKLTVDSIPPLTLAAARAGMAAIVVYGFMRLSGGQLPKFGAGWVPLVLLGLLTAVVPYVAIAWGQVLIDSSLGGILFATSPVFSVLIAPLVLAEERFTVDRLLGAGIGFSGVILIIGPQALSGLGAQLFGAIVTLIAAMSYAAGTIYARSQSHLSPVVMAAGQLVTAAVVLIPLSGLFDAPWTLAPTQAAVASLIVVALFSTVVPVLLLFWLVRNAGATNTNLLAFFMPVAAVILGVAILGERLSWGAMAGFGLIVLGAAFVTGKLGIGKMRQV